MDVRMKGLQELKVEPSWLVQISDHVRDKYHLQLKSGFAEDLQGIGSEYFEASL